MICWFRLEFLGLAVDGPARIQAVVVRPVPYDRSHPLCPCLQLGRQLHLVWFCHVYSPDNSSYHLHQFFACAATIIPPPNVLVPTGRPQDPHSGRQGLNCCGELMSPIKTNATLSVVVSYDNDPPAPAAPNAFGRPIASKPRSSSAAQSVGPSVMNRSESIVLPTWQGQNMPLNDPETQYF